MELVGDFSPRAKLVGWTSILDFGDQRKRGLNHSYYTTSVLAKRVTRT